MQTLLFLFVCIGRLTHEWTSSTTDRLWARLKQNWFYPSVSANALDSTHQQTMCRRRRKCKRRIYTNVETAVSSLVVFVTQYRTNDDVHNNINSRDEYPPCVLQHFGRVLERIHAIAVLCATLRNRHWTWLRMCHFHFIHLTEITRYHNIPMRRDIHEHIRVYTHFPMWRFGRTSGTIHVPQSSNWYNVRFALLEIIWMKLCSTQDRGCCRWSAVHLRLVSRTLSASVTIELTNECFGLFIFIIHRGPQSRSGGRWSWCMMVLTMVMMMMLSCKSSHRTACARIHARNHHV